MTKQKKEFLNKVLKLLSEKYERGDKEHKNNLFDLDVLQLMKEKRDEEIDELFFTCVIIEKLEKKNECGFKIE